MQSLRSLSPSTIPLYGQSVSVSLSTVSRVSSFGGYTIIVLCVIQCGVGEEKWSPVLLSQLVVLKEIITKNSSSASRTAGLVYSCVDKYIFLSRPP